MRRNTKPGDVFRAGVRDDGACLSPTASFFSKRTRAARLFGS